MNHQQSRNWIMICALIAICCLLWSHKGVRGTDQYWYLSDATTLATSGQTHSNTYYAGVILRNLTIADDGPNHFMHNGPALQLVSTFGDPENVYFTWMLLNALSHFFVALTIYIVAKRYTDRETATIASCLFLVSPIALWQSMNMLQEQSHAGIMAAFLLSYVFRHNYLVLILAAMVQVIGTLSHPIFFALSICFNIFLLASGLKNQQIVLAVAGLVTGGLCIYFKSIAHDLYPSSFQPGLAAIIAGAVPGKTNLLWHLAEVPPAITKELMFAKFTTALREHFINLNKAPFYFYTNLSVLALIVTTVTSAKKYAEILIPIALTLGIYAAMLVLMQNQPRYQQIVAPMAFVAIALAIHKLQHLLHKSIPIVLLAGTGLLGLYMSNSVRVQASGHAIENDEIKSHLADLPAEARVLSYDNGNIFDLRYSYLIKPRKLLVVKSEFLDAAHQIKAIRAFAPDYVFSEKPLENIPVDVSEYGSYELLSGQLNIYSYEAPKE